MTLQVPHCTEASHPPVFRFAGQESLYQKILASLAKHESAGITSDAMMKLLVTEFGEVLVRPSDYVQDGLRVQGIRRDIASRWGWDVIRAGESSQSHWMVHSRLLPQTGGE